MKAADSLRITLLVSAVLGLVALVLLNYLSMRNYHRWDWTDEGWFTLSDRTKEAVGNLEKDVTMYVLLARGEADFADVEELIEEYKALSPKLTVEWVDPDRDRARYEVLSEQLGIQSFGAGDLTLSRFPVVVTSGDRKWKVERHDLIVENFESFDDADGPKLDLQSERALTGAILEVTEGTPTEICVAEGHGEWPVMGDERSLSAVIEELEWERFEVTTVDLVGAANVPEKCNALLIVSPQRAYAEREVEAVLAYLRGGGNALLAFDPVLQKTAILPTGFEEPLRDVGIEVGPDIVVELEARRHYSDNPVDLFLVTDLSDHPVAEPISARGGGVMLSLARSVSAVEGKEAKWLLQTSPNSITREKITEASFLPKSAEEADLKLVQLGAAVRIAQDKVGPVRPGATSAAAKESPRGGRLLVIGDADWLREEVLQNPQLSNVDLLSSSIGWLTDREALINIAPRQRTAHAIIMAEEDLRALLFRVVFLLPFAAMVAGLGVWWSRRS